MHTQITSSAASLISAGFAPPPSKNLSIVSSKSSIIAVAFSDLPLAACARSYANLASSRASSASLRAPST